MNVIYIIAYNVAGGDEGQMDIDIEFYLAGIHHVLGNEKGEG